MGGIGGETVLLKDRSSTSNRWKSGISKERSCTSPVPVRVGVCRVGGAPARPWRLRDRLDRPKNVLPLAPVALLARE